MIALSGRNKRVGLSFFNVFYVIIDACYDSDTCYWYHFLAETARWAVFFVMLRSNRGRTGVGSLVFCHVVIL